MSDITCEYTITGTNQTGYFLLPRNTTYGQLVEFLRENVHPEDFVLKDYRREEIISSEQLEQLLKLSDEFVFPLYIEPVVAEQPAVPEPEPEIVKEELVEEAPVPAPEADASSKPFLGPICTRILSKFGVEVEIEEGFDPLDLIRQLPCFIAPLVEARYQEILANPDAMAPTLQFIADLAGESYEEFSSEVQNTLAQLRQQNEQPQEQEQKEEEKAVEEEQVPQEAPVSQVVHPAYCDKCQENIVGIRYKCIQCADYDLCVSCEAQQAQEPFHNHDHIFAKVYKSTFQPLPAHLAQPLPVPSCLRGVVLPRPCFVQPQPQSHPARGRGFHQRVAQLEQIVKDLQDQVNKLQ